MKHAFLLALRYLQYHRARSLILILCIALTFLLPAAVSLLFRSFSTNLLSRAAATPLVLGQPGSRYDLVLNSLYFRGRVPSALTLSRAEQAGNDDLATVIPLHTGHAARGYPIVGTRTDYFAFRGLELAEGALPALLGDAVLGAEVARELGLSAGGRILSDRGSLYDLTMAYPLRMLVAGVLLPTGGPDDGAVFVDLKTAWILDGIGHGHDDAGSADPDQVLARDGEQVALNASVVEYSEITAENIESFHFHGDPGELPVTAALVVPRNRKSGTILKGRYRVVESEQLLVPGEVVEEMLGFLLRVKRFFDANLLLVGSSTFLFLVLVVGLSLRVRRREMETLFKIGASRHMVVQIIGAELLMLVGVGVLASLATGWLLADLLRRAVLGF